MDLSTIRAIRLFNQQIVEPQFSNPKELVAHFGAMQAQDYNMAKWAIGLRLPGSTDESIEQAINDASIIRTHILRPTWHFVSADDIRWMMELTAPRIRPVMNSNNKLLGLNQQIFDKSNSIIEKALAGKYLTRAELMAELAKEGINTSDLRASHIMFNAELDLLVCNGPMRDKQFTYALLDKRVPKGNTLSREEALAELAKRYFTSHGPASLADFSWWSGLSLTDSKLAINLTQHLMQNEVVGETDYWFFATSYSEKSTKSLRILPAFDEFLISYKDRSASVNKLYSAEAMTNNGIFKPIIVLNGEVVGVWKREIKRDTIVVEPRFFKPVSNTWHQKFLSDLKHFGKFLNKKVVVKAD
ncbi:MAG: winged helix DNA-binding domain-containing protein [Sphingobacteriaceae bacterium]